MVSCNDIPNNLLGLSNFDSFVQWLHAHVPDRADRKALGKCWAENSGVRLTRAMWLQILEPPMGPNDR